MKSQRQLQDFLYLSIDFTVFLLYYQEYQELLEGGGVHTDLQTMEKARNFVRPNRR